MELSELRAALTVTENHLNLIESMENTDAPPSVIDAFRDHVANQLVSLGEQARSAGKSR